MRTKEEYYHSVLKNRSILEDPQVLQCSCPHTLCEWHGNCRECVAIHRYHGDRLPNCMRSMMQDQLMKLADVAGLDAAPADIPELEYHLYVRARDQLKSK